jgi:hypothetical protein
LACRCWWRATTTPGRSCTRCGGAAAARPRAPARAQLSRRDLSPRTPSSLPTHQVDPSGAYFGWRASAIGKNYTNAKTFLEKRYTPEIEVEDAVHTALLTMREGFEGEMTATNIEIGVIGADKKFRVLPAAAVADYLAEAE